MKKIIKSLFLILLVLPCLVLFSACSDNGLSAYEIAVKNGFQGTEVEWLESLKGEKGESGTNGADGKDSISSYKMWEEAFAKGETTLGYADWVAENFDIIFDEEKYAINKNLLSVVEVQAFTSEKDLKLNQNSKNAGSAVMFEKDADGNVYYVTNYHLTYYSTGTKKAYPYFRLDFFEQSAENYMTAEFIGGSAIYDLAVLKVDAENFIAETNAKVVTFAETAAVSGSPVLAIGNSNGDGINVSGGVLGVVDIESEYVDITIAGVTASHRVLRHDVFITNGNSGGGLFDMNGNCVGITNGGSKTDATIKYAIPADLVQKVANQLIYNYKENSSSFYLKVCELGLGKRAVSIFSSFNEKTQLVEIVDTTKIISVDESSALYEKVFADDVLVSASLNENKIAITRAYMFDEFMIDARIGDVLTIKVKRGEKTIDVQIELTEDMFEYIQ